MLTPPGKIVDLKDAHHAIESAYAKLPDGERARIDELVDVLIQRMLHRRGIGEQTGRQILGAIGIYLVEHPRIRARFDDGGHFVGFTEEFHSQARVRPPVL